jgi:hypothetical protein
MSLENEVPVTPVTTSYTTSAQARVEEIRAMRELIPRFVIPASNAASRRLNSAASVPPQFVELAAVAVTNSEVLVRPGGVDPAETRDLMSYAEAYSPVADELEALAHFIRHSVRAARNKAGSNALSTYALAQLLAKRPETADLAPHVADMRNALKKRFGQGGKARPAPPATPPVMT